MSTETPKSVNQKRKEAIKAKTEEMREHLDTMKYATDKPSKPEKGAMDAMKKRLREYNVANAGDLLKDLADT